MRQPKRRNFPSAKQKLNLEKQEIDLLEQWIEEGKPDSGTNPISLPPLPPGAPVGRTGDNTFSRYAGCKLFEQLPISQKTKDGLKPKYTEMTKIQRASLPHTLCGRDVLGAAKTGSGKTLAFIIPVIEKLYRAQWDSDCGVGSIIISPTKELAGQLFEELKSVGKYHSLSAGLLIGGRKDVDAEKERVNSLNILVCTPGRLHQHLDETPYFDCADLQILVLDEADRILDAGFKKQLDAIIKHLPKQRQTLLFSATQTKSVQDLARLSLKDPEYLSVHAESMTATPKLLKQVALEVPLDQKLDMLWSFIKEHLNSKMLVFLSSCKQVKYVFETFKKLRPGIPLMCLHGRMKHDVRMAIYAQFCEKRLVLISTDVASRGLDFPAVDWVIQVDCPEDIAAYIHRVGRTARFNTEGKSVLFLLPSETEMVTKLQAAKPRIPIELKKAKMQKLQPISGLLASLLVKYPNMQHLAQRAFITYLRSIHMQRDKDVFDVSKLPIEDFAASLGLPMMPKVRFLRQIGKGSKTTVEVTTEQKNRPIEKVKMPAQNKSGSGKPKEVAEQDILLAKETSDFGRENEDVVPPTRILKKKKLKINVHRPAGTRVVFDEEGTSLPPLAALADTLGADNTFDLGKVEERFKKLKEELKHRDKEDKLVHRQRLREKRTKEKTKMKRRRDEEGEVTDDDEYRGSDGGARDAKSSKIYFDSDGDENEEERKMGRALPVDPVSLAEQEALALKLLSSMHS